MGGRVETGIELKIFYFDTIINYWSSQKLKLLENDEFNHLTIILIDKYNGKIMVVNRRIENVTFK